MDYSYIILVLLVLLSFIIILIAYSYNDNNNDVCNKIFIPQPLNVIVSVDDGYLMIRWTGNSYIDLYKIYIGTDENFEINMKPIKSNMTNMKIPLSNFKSGETVYVKITGENKYGCNSFPTRAYKINIPE